MPTPQRINALFNRVYTAVSLRALVSLEGSPLELQMHELQPVLERQVRGLASSVFRQPERLSLDSY